MPTSVFVRELPVASARGRTTTGSHNMVVPYRGNAQYMGDPDGPMRFIKSLGMEVPTYIDPRNDLKTTYKTAGAHKAVDYHIPPKFRGPYKPTQLADYDPDKHYPVLSQTGFARCGGVRSDGQICQKTAMHRTGFCSNHGGALHPADKLFTSERGIMPTSPEKLDRHQKVEMGIIPVSELSDEEIARQQVRMDDGTFSQTSPMLSARILNAMKAEFFARADRFLRENVMDMLKEMRNIATSQVAEDKDKIAAAQWLIERSMGKTPDVLITNKTDTPFENMMGEVISTTRADYRNQQPALHGGVPVIEGEIDNGITILDDEEFESELVGEQSDESQVEIEAPVVEAQLTPLEAAKARREKKKEIQRRRQRRFAAKSRGLDTIDDLPYELVFKEVKLKSGTVTRMKLLSADEQKMR